MKNFFYFLILTIFLSACKTENYTQSRSLLKEYAFCKCLQFTSDDSTFLKSDISISVYRDIAHYNFDSYDKIDSLSKITAFRILPSIISDHEKKKAILMECLNIIIARH
jgi:hypothetical protein